MDIEVVIAIFKKLLDERLSNLELPVSHGPRGPRGATGPQGERGGDGKSFVFAEHEEAIREMIKDISIKFSDLTQDQIESLRGPRGKDGKSFIFAEHEEVITEVISSFIKDNSHLYKLSFNDLSEHDKAELKGPKGERGPRGKDFVFEEHLEFFNGLKLKFSDLTDDERALLKLKFNDLTEDEKDGLKLKFSDLSDEDKFLLKGSRGQRGKQGPQGIQGENGPKGDTGPEGAMGPRGVRGVPGPSGIPGINGADGRDGKDAPTVVDIKLNKDKNSVSFTFVFSDGSEIETDSISIPSETTTYIVGGIGSGSGSGGGGTGADGKSAYEIAVDNGFIGTEVEWLASLQGEAGPEGPEGTQGPAGVFDYSSNIQRFRIESLAAYDRIASVTYLNPNTRIEVPQVITLNSAAYPDSELVKTIYYLDLGSINQRIEKIEYVGGVLAAPVRKVFNYSPLGSKFRPIGHYYETY